VQIITLTSDYGANTYYAAALKAKLLALLPQIVLVDVSHNLPPYDLTQAAFLVQSCMPNFVQQTVHIIAVDTNLALHQRILVGQKQNQWIIAADNGFLSMVSNTWDKIYSVNQSLYSVNDLSPEKNVFTQVAANIINGVTLDTYLTETAPSVILDNLKPVIGVDQIRATIVHVDGYDNAITNLDKQQFEAWIGEDKYKIFYRKKESLDKIEQNYSMVSPGSGVAVFNDMGWLEIAINRGQGRSLLGLKLGDQIIIEKQP
jgi:S-adenosylmethionine hydrolase